MKLPELQIADLKAKLPIIQGGMAIRVSMAELAAAVANEGGIGVIGASVMTPKELKLEIKKARKLLSKKSAMNIMPKALCRQ